MKYLRLILVLPVFLMVAAVVVLIFLGACIRAFYEAARR